jgi:hypothetical protein
MLKTVSTLGNFANVVTLTSTDPGAAAGPLLDLYRDSASPAAADTLGEIEFNGEDSAGNKQQYALIHGSIISPTSGAEGGQIHFETTTAGASTEKMIIGTTNLVINEIGAIYNVRIEGDTDANLLYTDATNSRVGVGTISPAEKLDVVGNIKLSGNLVVASGQGIDFSATSGTGTSELLDDYEEGTFTATLTGSTTAPTTPATTTARYTKIGRQVTIEVSFLNSDTTGASGNIQVTGLPFTAGELALGVTAVNATIPLAFPAFQLAPGNTFMSMIQITTGANIAIPSSTGVFIFCTLTYTV